jgi:hypothetical protein
MGCASRHHCVHGSRSTGTPDLRAPLAATISARIVGQPTGGAIRRECGRRLLKLCARNGRQQHSARLRAITESSLHEIRERNPGVEAEMVAFRLAAFGLSVLDPDSQRRGSHRGKLSDGVRD